MINQYKNSQFKNITHQQKIFISSLIASIALYRDEIFDWLIDQDYFQSITKENIGVFDTIMKFSAKNNNAHSIKRICERGYDISDKFSKNIAYASANGFYKLIQFLCFLAPKEKPKIYYTYYKIADRTNVYFFPCLYSENLSIFNNTNYEMLQLMIEYSISRAYFNIIKYFFENHYRIAINFKSEFALYNLLSSLDYPTDDLFNLLFNYFQIIYKDYFESSDLISRIILKACTKHKENVAKNVIQSSLQEYPKKDFSFTFANLVEKNSINLCKFILDKKLYINYYKLIDYFDVIQNVNEETFSLFINNIPFSIKQLFVLNNLNIAIKSGNIYLIRYLYNQKAESEFALIEAVSTNNIEVVDTVLEFFNPIYINQNSEEGTALIIAAKNNNLTIFKKLLSISNIDPSIPDSNNFTPLSIAILKYNKELVDCIFDFYGSNLQKQTQQLNESIKLIFELESNSNKRFNSFGQSNKFRFSFGQSNKSRFSFGQSNKSRFSFGQSNN